MASKKNIKSLIDYNFEKGLFLGAKKFNRKKISAFKNLEKKLSDAVAAEIEKTAKQELEENLLLGIVSSFALDNLNTEIPDNNILDIENIDTGSNEQKVVEESSNPQSTIEDSKKEPEIDGVAPDNITPETANTLAEDGEQKNSPDLSGLPEPDQLPPEQTEPQENPRQEKTNSETPPQTLEKPATASPELPTQTNDNQKTNQKQPEKKKEHPKDGVSKNSDEKKPKEKKVGNLPDNEPANEQVKNKQNNPQANQDSIDEPNSPEEDTDREPHDRGEKNNDQQDLQPNRNNQISGENQTPNAPQKDQENNIENANEALEKDSPNTEKPNETGDLNEEKNDIGQTDQVNTEEKMAPNETTDSEQQINDLENTEEKPESPPPQTDGQRAAQLQKNRNANRQQQLKDGTFDPDKFLKEEGLDEDKELFGDKRKIGAKKVGQAIGNELANRIRTGDFKGYALAMTLAILIDTGNVAEFLIDGGLMGSLLNIVFSSAMYGIIYSESGFIKRQIKKRYYQKIFKAIFLKFIPGANVIPFYTFMVWSIKRDADKNIKRHKKIHARLMQQMERQKQDKQTRANQNVTRMKIEQRKNDSTKQNHIPLAA